MPDEWDGIENRREHDKACEKRLARLVKEVGKDICIATKGNAAWNKFMRPIIMFILFAIMGGQIWGTIVNAEQSKTDTLQSSDIEHNQEMIENLNSKYDLHLREQRAVNSVIIEKLNSINVQVGRIEESVE